MIALWKSSVCMTVFLPLTCNNKVIVNGVGLSVVLLAIVETFVFLRDTQQEEQKMSKPVFLQYLHPQLWLYFSSILKKMCISGCNGMTRCVVFGKYTFIRESCPSCSWFFTSYLWFWGGFRAFDIFHTWKIVLTNFLFTRKKWCSVQFVLL